MVDIAFFDTKPYDQKSFDEINRKFGFNIKYFNHRLSLDSVALCKNFKIVCVFVNDVISAEVVEALNAIGVKLIALRCAGYNNVDFKSAFGKVHVVRVPAYSPYAVAEHALALILTLNRKVHKAYNRTRENNFSIDGLLGFDLNGKTIGVIGTGKIGQIFINICRGLGLKVLAYDPFPLKNSDYEYVDLATLYAKSDLISMHCPLTKETHHIINADSIKKMKKGVMLINTSRGGLIDTKALIAGLKSGQIGSAGLDVYEEEHEYFFEDFSGEVVSDDVLARLLSFNNVLVTAHQAFFTKEALHNIAETTLNNIKDFLDNKPLKNEICYQCHDLGNCQKNKTGKCF